MKRIGKIPLAVKIKLGQQRKYSRDVKRAVAACSHNLQPSINEVYLVCTECPYFERVK